MIKTFASQSSFHGMHYIVNSSNKRSRIFWICVITAGFGLFTFQLCELIHKFMEKPKVTSIELQSPKEGLSMPNFTVCILNRANKSIIERKYPEIDYQLLEYMSSSFLSAYSTTLYNIHYFARNSSANASLDPNETLSVQASMLNLTHTLSLDQLEINYHELFRSDKYAHLTLLDFFQSVSFTCEDVFPDPACWFENAQVFNCCDHAHRFLSHNGPCFYFEAAEYRQRLPGPVGGFGFAYWHPTDNLLPTIFNSYHERAVHLFMSPMDALLNIDPIAISPGLHAHISVEATNYKLVQGGYFDNACKPDRTLKYFAQYTDTACQAECMVDTFMKQCNCTGLNTYMKLSKWQICEPRQALNCFMELANNFSDILALCHIKQCPPACHFWKFSPTISTGVVFHPSLEEKMRRYWQFPYTESISDSLIMADLYYTDIRYTKVTEVYYFKIETFVSNIGGALGLWTGASIVTVVHMFYWLCYCICFSNRNNDATNQNNRRAISENNNRNGIRKYNYPHQAIPANENVLELNDIDMIYAV